MSILSRFKSRIKGKIKRSSAYKFTVARKEALMKAVKASAQKRKNQALKTAGKVGGNTKALRAKNKIKSTITKLKAKRTISKVRKQKAAGTLKSTRKAGRSTTSVGRNYDPRQNVSGKRASSVKKSTQQTLSKIKKKSKLIKPPLVRRLQDAENYQKFKNYAPGVRRSDWT